MRHQLRGLPLAVLFAVAVVGLGGVAGESVAEPPKKKGDGDGKNDKPGRARWEWKLLGPKGGKAAQTGTFHGYLDGSIMMGKPQKLIGTAKADPADKNKITVSFTDGPLKGGEGTLLMVERKPIQYRGDFTQADGKKVKMEVTVIND